MTRAGLFPATVTPTGLTFQRRLRKYRDWREELIRSLIEYQSWVEQQGLSNGEDDLRVYELIDTLKTDKLPLALVAEFSRGKTELINAIFFADYKQRVLPSEAGRTTMCPTELLYDERESPCIKLLPIETRTLPVTINELKRSNSHWTTIGLRLGDSRRMQEVFQEIMRTKDVGVREAERLGLYRVRGNGVGQTVNSDGTVTIPVWRHAIVNFPHPLLEQGLVILDTPGLNSLGTEPELTLSMLPSALGVLFVLAADTGVTRSDLEVWNTHVRAGRRGEADGRLVALNKIDTLWDELRSETAVDAMLARQLRQTAHVLGVGHSQVFAVSAQKGLLGKVKGDRRLIKRSGLPELEERLATDVIGAKQAIIRERVTREIGDIIDTTRAMVEARLSGVRAQLQELVGLSGKSDAVIQTMIARMRGEQQAYERTLASFQTTRVVISDQIRLMLDHLSIANFDAMTAATRESMHDAWTTQALRNAMGVFFDRLLEAMEKANKQALAVRSLVQGAYHRFHAEHGLARIRPNGFSLLPFRSQLQRLYEEAEAFRNSPVMVMTEQHFVVKRFFITLVARARTIFNDCNVAAQAWSKAILAPMLSQVREHKLMMERRLDNLKKVHENLDNLSARIAECEATQQALENQLAVIDEMTRSLNTPIPLDS